MKLQPHVLLTFNGQCEAAFKLYAECLNGTLPFMLTWGNSPSAAEVPPEWSAKIFHATLDVGGTIIAGGDLAPGKYTEPQGFSIVLEMDDPAVADRAFHALADGGRIETPLQETFWASRFGAVTDRFGIPWVINSGR